MMTQLMKIAAAGFVAAVVGLFTYAADAQVRLDITRGRVEPMPIAIPMFPGSSPEVQQLGRDIAGVVTSDLERSGLFRPLDPKAFLQELTSLDIQPRFQDWRTLA